MVHFLEERYKLIKYDIYTGLTYNDIFYKFMKENLMLKQTDINKFENNEQKIYFLI